MNILKTIAILLLVGIGTYAILLYNKPLPTQSESKEMTQTTLTSISSTSAQTRLFFSPSTTKLIGVEPRTIPLMIQTGTNAVSTVQVELRYNPLQVTVASITPGDFLPEPEIILSDIDNTRGRINYALTTSSPASQIKGGGTLVVLNMAATNTASISGNTQIEFLPKTAVRSQDSLSSLLQSTENLLITF